MAAMLRIISRVSAVIVAGLANTGWPAFAEPLDDAGGFGRKAGVYERAVPSTGTEDEVERATDIPARLRRQLVSCATDEKPGTIIVDTPNAYLYFVIGRGQAMRYGIGVGRKGFTWSGVTAVERKTEWPDGFPPGEMLTRQPYLPQFMAGGPGNPLGARAMYLKGTIYHPRDDAPSSIGKRVSSGCIRLLNSVFSRDDRHESGRSPDVSPVGASAPAPQLTAAVDTLATGGNSGDAFRLY